jgi:sirohydrochlorin cobaltochelatase
MMRDFSRSALVIVGHGSTRNPDSSAPTRDHARAIRDRAVFREVHACFWKEEPSLRDILREVTSEEVYVVPNFISEGYFTRTVIPQEMGLTGAVTHCGHRIVKYCAPVGSHPGMTDLLLRRAREAAPNVPPSQTSLFIVGHGTVRDANSATAAREQAARIAARGDYAEVVATYIEEAPRIANWDQLSSQPHVVVLPFFIANGLHSYEDIPNLLGLDSSPADPAGKVNIFQRNPRVLRGRRLYYTAAIGTEPGVADVIIEQAAAVAGEEKGAP